MFKSMLCTSVLIAAAMQLSACGGMDVAETALEGVAESERSKPGNGTAACERLNGTTYYSVTLEESGRTQTGINLGHWQVSFADGTISTFQSDFGEIGTYACEDGVVTATFHESSHRELQFSKDWQELQYNPLNLETITFRLTNETVQPADCAQLRGKKYTASVDRPGFAPEESAVPFVEFGEGQQVDFTLGDDIVQRGIYDCDLGVLHVHADESDEQPLIFDIEKEGSAISLQANGRKLVLEPDEVPTLCTHQYEPVCAIKPAEVQCVTTPCPIGFYQTFGNRCQADVAEAEVAFAGECGSLEGEPVVDELNCTTEYEPVCAAAVSTAPCLEAPCPALVHKTFGNSCAAGLVGAPVLFEGECGKAEGTPVAELELICPAVVDPVCALTRAQIACITEPCPSHQYQTFSNACEAERVVSTIAFKGECGALQDVVTFGEPPVKIATTLPETSKIVAIDEVVIEGDTVSLSLSYTGCEEQHFEMYVSDAFRESLPVQAAYVFKPIVEDNCKAVLQTRLNFDLRPLKYAYQKAYRSEHGEVVLPQIGTYSF